MMTMKSMYVKRQNPQQFAFFQPHKVHSINFPILSLAFAKHLLAAFTVRASSFLRVSFLLSFLSIYGELLLSK